MNWIAIMAGGGGTRLWPLSRRRRPKQFLSLLDGGESLLAGTLRRARAIVPLERIVVITSASQVDEVRRAVLELPRDNIVIEPEARNTAPCIGVACIDSASSCIPSAVDKPTRQLSFFGFPAPRLSALPRLIASSAFCTAARVFAASLPPASLSLRRPSCSCPCAAFSSLLSSTRRPSCPPSRPGRDRRS